MKGEIVWIFRCVTKLWGQVESDVTPARWHPGVVVENAGSGAASMLSMYASGYDYRIRTGISAARARLHASGQDDSGYLARPFDGSIPYHRKCGEVGWKTDINV